jgi:uncharacterized protein YjbI with pentapeptide repeats
VTTPASQTRAPRIAPVRLGRLIRVDDDRFAEDENDLESVDLVELSRDEMTWEVRRRLDSSRVRGLRVGHWWARGLAISESVLERLDVVALSAAESGWRRVEIRDSRIGSSELFDSTWRAVHFVNSKLGYLNLRDAQVSDLQFTNCIVEDLDLIRAKATRVSFTDCRIGRIELTGATLVDVDLRGAQLTDVGDLAGLAGATVSLEQLLDLAPLMAARLGVKVE